ncbi:alpha-2-macroglobulin-like protein, partial [Plakobranchus ocellatus]
KFKVLTLLSSLKPIPSQIYSVDIRNNYLLMVKRYLNLTTKGILLLEFQLDKKAKPGFWRIIVNLDNKVKASAKITVKEYYPNRFEINIDSPSYILQSEKIMSGRVCSRYFSGEYVTGQLSLEFCRMSETLAASKSIHPCYHIEVRLHGCYTFSMNTDLLRTENVFTMLKIRANVTADKTGVMLSKTKTVTEESEKIFDIRLYDYTNGIFKPGLPYYGKVIVTKPNGTRVARKKIVVTAKSWELFFHFSRHFITDKRGEVDFALCDDITEVTNMRISAQSIKSKQDENGLWKSMNLTKRFSTNLRYVRQWYSISDSYIQLPKIHSPCRCNEQARFTVLFKSPYDFELHFYYQVMARGHVVTTGKMTPRIKTGFGKAMPPSGMCLQKKEASSDRKQRDDAITDRVQKRDDVVEPVERSTEESVFSFPLKLKIKSIMFPKFTLLLYYVTLYGEVVADSMQYDVEPCFENQVCSTIAVS